MAHARLVTRTPEFAQTLAGSLEDAGYSVEFASPDVVSHGTLVGVPLEPADLEVNLDDPSAASSYLMTPDGKEISFAYDSFEREFVLAPAWRKFKQSVAPMLASFRRPSVQENAETESPQPIVQHRAQPEAIQSVAPVFAEASSAPPAYVDQSSVRAWDAIPEEPVDDSAATTKLEPVSDSGLLAQSLYLPGPVFVDEPAPESVEFSGAEYFDGQGKRKISGHEDLASFTPHIAADKIDPATATREDARPVVSAASSPRTPWLVSAALRAEAARTLVAAQWHQHRTGLAGAGSRLRGYDAEWLRAAPVAAVITLAFLMGWGYSNAQRATPERAEPVAFHAGEPLQQAAVMPLPPSKPVGLSKPAAATANPSAVKRAADRSVETDEHAADDIAADVVVRHYPSRGTRAAVQSPKGTVKRFSDIE